MSVKININGLRYDQLSCAQRAKLDKNRKERITQVRQQSNEIAQKVREKVEREKENQLRKFQQIKFKEAHEWKKRRQCEIQQEYGNCLANFGAAHIAACEASCEEDETLRQKREDNDLMAAQRGRSAMLQEQRKRDRQAEERLAKRKRKLQRNAGVQADLVSRREFGANFSGNVDENECEDQSEEDESEAEEEEKVSSKKFVSKPNLHKSLAPTPYNPKNFTSNSVDSSNNCESEDNSTLLDVDSEEEFNQITNMLKQKSGNLYTGPSSTNFIEITDSSDNEMISQPIPKTKSKKVTLTPTKKGILKKPLAKKAIKSKPKSPEKKQKVSYVDFANKYSSSYIPSDDLVTRNNQKTSSNAFSDAEIHERAGVRNISDSVLRQLAEVRAKEALEKEKTRRDYERLRLELDEVSKQEQEAKEAAGKALRNITASQLSRQEESRKTRMNQAVEKTFKRNIITCPPVDSTQRKTKEKSCEVNVAGHGNRTENSSRSDSITIVEQGKKPLKSNEDISNLVKVERLKDLLERINHQKKLVLREIEKSDDIPGRDLDKMMECLKKLEQEKAALDPKPKEDERRQKIAEEFAAREQKLTEREKKLENGVRELYKTQKELKTAAAKMPEPEIVSTTTSESSRVIPPVEIVIKVHSKSPRKSKHRKTIRCLDTLNREPTKVYPRTPRKQKTTEVKNQEPIKVQQETQTTPSLIEAPKTILKKATQVSPALQVSNRKSDDSSQSVSTTYQSLPDKIAVGGVSTPAASIRKQHHKLNPVLMHYITRLLGMGKNIDNQLHVDVSSVSTPGSSTINTSGNKSNISDARTPQFDEERLAKLKDFINDNYSFLSEVNDTLENDQVQEQNEENISLVEGIWNDVLRKKKSPKSLPKEKTQTAKPTQTTKPPTSKSQPPARPPPPMKTNSSNLKPTVPAKPTLVLRRPSTVQQTPPARLPQTSLQVPSSRNQARPRSAAVSTQRQISTGDLLNVSKYLESHILNNFSEQTENCMKRIADLAQMMERVRHEKQKIIENSMSSGEFGHYTEYREIAVPAKGKDNQTTSASDNKESPSQREDPPSEEINNILQKQTRPFGVSKDSGISSWSRPVTSSDFRDSPDVRVTSEERESTFQPILKDIPKPPKMKVTQADGGPAETLNISALIKEQEEKALRKLKPPVALALNRVSPTADKQHKPHELSTIAEVETPSASKVNLLEKVEENMEIDSFPNFDDYAKKLQAQNQQGAETASSFVTLGDLNDILDEMKLKSFAAPKDYGIKEISHDDESQPSSGSSSIIDIGEELKRREIYNEPFKFIDEKENSKPVNEEEMRVVRPENRILIKIPESANVEIQSKSPKKRLTADQLESPKSSDTLTGIQELEKESKEDIDAPGIGQEWARAKSKPNKAASSSSSSSGDRGKSIEIEIQTSTYDRSSSSSSSNSIAQPMNLREFLTRELNAKAKRDNSLSDESSLSSQFMRSLLKATSGNSSSASRSGEASDGERLRTSTPLQARSTSTPRQGNGNSPVNKNDNTPLFPGDSLSTLKGSEGEASGSSDKSKHN